MLHVWIEKAKKNPKKQTNKKTTQKAVEADDDTFRIWFLFI